MGDTDDNKYFKAWNEDNWEQEMKEHPFYARYFPDASENLANHAIAQGISELQYNPEYSSGKEVAESFKEEGIFYYKAKKYKLAVVSYSEAFKQDFEDNEFKASIYNNRSAAHFYLGNYKSCIEDCLMAVSLKKDYLKAYERAGKCYKELGQYDNCINHCDEGILTYPECDSFVALRKEAVKEKQKMESKKRREEKFAKMKRQKNQKIWDMLLDKKYLDESLRNCENEDIDNILNESTIKMNSNSELQFDVIILYPQSNESDLIQEFNENIQIREQLEELLENPAPWDPNHKFKIKNIKVCFKDESNEIVEFSMGLTLREVMSHKRYPNIFVRPEILVYLK